MEVDKENVVVALTTLESLPVDIRTDIFSRLDAKTLTRFLCVSKPFSSFVSTPELIAAHRLRSRLNPRLLFEIEKDGSNTSFCYFDINTKDVIQVSEHPPLPDADFKVKTCLELVCVCNVNNTNEIHILNPTNNRSLPLPPLDVSSRYPSSGYFQFHTVSFGYVASTNDYKVLCITHLWRHNTTSRYDIFLASIFTVGTDTCWRDVEDAPLRIYYDATVVNEAAYFQTYERSIISFDLAREEWSLLPVLPFVPKIGSYLAELGGHLCLVQTGYEIDDIDIWMLHNVDTFFWSNEFHIDKSNLIDFGFDGDVLACALIIDKEGRLLMYLNYIGEKLAKLAYYDPRSGNFEDFHIKEKLSLGDEDDMSFLTMYLDSLMSLEYHY